MKRWIIVLLLLIFPGIAQAAETILHNAATANVNGGNISVGDKGSLGLNLNISGTATVTFQGSTDSGNTWSTIGCIALGGTAESTSATASGQYQCSVGGITHVRTPISGCSGCTVSVAANSSLATRGSGPGVNLTTCISGESACIGTSPNSYIQVTGQGIPKPTTVATGITTNTTSATFTLPAGAKTPLAKVAGTGAQTQTWTIFGAYDSTATLGDQLCVITLSATTKDYATCDSQTQITIDYPFYYYVTSNTTGTGATGELIVYSGLSARTPAEFSYSGLKTADALVKTGAGFLQCIIIAEQDAAPTAGTIAVNDATSAGTGTKIFEWSVGTTVFSPLQICPQTEFRTGLYIDFTTTADVYVSVSYR